MPPDRAAAIVVAAGRGVRMGGIAKVLVPLNGKPVLAYSLDAIEAANSISSVVIVTSPETLLHVADLVERSSWTKLAKVVVGGKRRQDSVFAGLAAIDADIGIVAVHDGARPFASAALFDACVNAAREPGAAIAAIPVVDTLKLAPDRTIVKTIDRSDLWAAQTPQAVRVELLRTLLQAAVASGAEVTDEAMLLESAGLPVQIVEGSRFNLKITHSGDLSIAEAFGRILAEQS